MFKTNLIKKIIAIICIVALAIPSFSTVVTATISSDKGEKLKLGISELNQDGWGYKISGKQTYRTYVDNEGTRDYSNAIYCLDYTKKFPGETTNTNNYESIGDLDNSIVNKSEVQKIANSMYVSSMSQDKKDEVLNKVFEKTIEEGKDLKPATTLQTIKNTITEDDIFFAQQCAIWKYTNGLDWKGASVEMSNDGDNWYQVSTIGQARYDYMADIYDYYTSGNLEEETNPTLVKTNKTCTEVEDGYIVGPFQVKSGTNTNYTVDLVDQNGNKLTDYTLVNSEGTKIVTDLKNTVNTDFYVKLPISTTTTLVTLKLTVKTYETVTTQLNADEDGMQPMMIVEKKEKTIEDTDSATVQKADRTYDLALRKYITKIGTKEIETRTPKVELDENSQEISYKHPKSSVELKPGDLVTYTITVYNEGNRAGKATKIKDYLPEGLEFVKNSETNNKYGWVVSMDGTYAITDYTNKYPELEPFNKEKNQLSCISVEIECKVKDDFKSGTLTNIAEIVEDNIDDADSNTASVQIENIDKENYKGNTNNKNDLTDSDYYYRGQEDDDDFERVEVIPEEKEVEKIDLALKKYISTVNGKNQNREPKVNPEPLLSEKTDAEYTMSKEPVQVNKGDIVIYSIRVYNEGKIDAYANEITDYIPEGLGFIPNHQINYNNQWKIDDSIQLNTVKLSSIKNATNNVSKSDFVDVESVNDVDVVVGKAKIKSDLLKYTDGGNNNVIKAFNASTSDISYKVLQVACVVTADEITNDVIKNIAAVTGEVDKDGNVVPDVDSKPEDIDTSKYPENNNMEDDDDYDNIVLKGRYDLALKKFIVSVNDKELDTSREPKVNTQSLKDGKTDAEYETVKEPVKVKKGDKVTYTIRVYNEGEVSAHAKEIIDTVPNGLEFIPYITDSEGNYLNGSKTNYDYGWKVFNDKNNSGWTDGVKTTYLADTELKPFNKETGEIDYKDLKIEFEVVTSDASEIKNIAEITEDDGPDEDSTPNNKNENEDDEDYDKVIPEIFDLALQKFITGINEKEITTRNPLVSIENEKIKYSHTPTPLDVANGNIVTYTIRVYNEGNIEGYASEVKDDIPKGLVFIKDDETNIKYGWKLYYKDEQGKLVETDDVSKATEIRTTYLSKEESENRKEDNLLKAFDINKGITDENPDYRDVQVAFKVDQSNIDLSDRVIINTAEITKNTDKNGNKVDDNDSTPDNNIESEDDLDKEKIQIKYFDLSLLKYLSKVVVIEDGKVKETSTGYDGTENPEPSVKVEINRKKLKSTEIKFIYTLKITNEGELEGYAKEISDRIPEGLVFYEEDNKDYKWKVSENGVVTTDYLADTLLKPGESKTVEIVLRWNKNENDLGLKVNVAEITKDYNEYNTPDIDSTPNNNKEGEDDQDTAPVILSISTGSEPMYIVLIITTLTILGVGMYSIKKYVL